MEIYNIFKNIDVGEIRLDEPMSRHTTFKIGGPADLMIIPNSEEEILNAVKTCRENNLKFMIMGNGSNLLVRDGGIRGIVIKLNDNFNDIKIDGNKLYCQSGVLMSVASGRAMENELTGLEFCNGIPGTIGGAVTMNAGAYGGETKEVVSKVRAISKDNEIVEFNNEEMNFRYRGSRVHDEELIVLGVEYSLEKGNFEEIKETMDTLTYKRVTKQPLDLPSGGSTFKRPEGYYAGKLIDDSGLRGLTYGGAQVSKKHCGFVVNSDNATCDDVLKLISSIRKIVMDNYGVYLETEIKIIGEDL